MGKMFFTKGGYKMETKTMTKHLAIILAISAAIFFLGGCI